MSLAALSIWRRLLTHATQIGKVIRHTQALQSNCHLLQGMLGCVYLRIPRDHLSLREDL